MFSHEYRSIAIRLKFVREKRNMSQTELSRITGIAASNISHYESGRRAPSIFNLAKIADALEVSIDFIMGMSVFVEYVQFSD